MNLVQVGYRAASLLAPALLLTCILPNEPTTPRSRITFKATPDTLVVALRDTAALHVSVRVDGQVSAVAPHYVIESLSDGHVAVTSDGRPVGLARGLGGVRLRLVTGAAGDTPVDTVLPVRVVLERVTLSRPADTMTALGDTLVPRPGYRDGHGASLTVAESAAVTPQLTLVSPGRAVRLGGAGLVSYANGVDTVMVGADTAHVAFAVLVRQKAVRVRGLPDSLRLIALTQTWQLTDSAFDRRNRALGPHAVAWTSANPAVVAVTTAGLATAVANGSTALLATVDGTLDSVPVAVAQTARQVQALSGSGQSGMVGTTLAAPFVAQVADSLGFAAPVAGVAVTFHADSGGGTFGGAISAVATTNAQGRASATLTLGTVAGMNNVASASATGLIGSPAFTAVGGPAAAYQVVLVSGGGQSAGAGALLPSPFVVAVRDTFGNAVPNFPVLFRVTAGGGTFGTTDTVTVLSDATGTARATVRLGLTIGVGVNAVAIRGTSLTTALVTVTADGLVPVATVTVTPATATLNVGGTVQLAVATKDSAGGVLTGRRVVWGSSAPAVAPVDTTGKVTALAVGDATIQAQAEGKTGSAAITMLGPATSIVVTPDTVRLRSLDTARVTATLRDAAGHVLSGTPGWSSSDTIIATVTSSGKITARFDGATNVRAASGALSDTTRVIVAPIAVASVDVQPKNVTLYAVGETSQLTVTARDSVSQYVPTARYQFSSANAAVATVSGTGLVTAVAAGTATIRAVSGAASDSAQVQVQAAQSSCGGTGGTTHSVTISASETWAKAGNPHRLTASVAVTGNVVLTIEAGALMCASSFVGLTLQGGARLAAIGTSADRIIFTQTTSGVNWNGLNFTGTSSDTSRLTFARVEFTSGTAVTNVATHPLVLDSVVIRQTQSSGLTLSGAGSRATRTLVQGAALSGGAGYAGVYVGNGATLDGVLVQSSGYEGVVVNGPNVRLNNLRIQGSANVGLEVQGSGTLTQATNIRIVGGAGYPLRTTTAGLTLFTAVPAESLLGNVDTMEVTGGAGTLTGIQVTVSPVLPWRVTGTVTVDTQAVLVVRPGAKLAMGSNASLVFQRGARLVARGTAANPIVFTRLAATGTWSGLYFTSTTPPGDSSYLTNARLEYLSYYSGQAAVYATGAHPMVLDSVLIRQASYSAVRLDVAGSRLSRSEIDTSGTVGNYAAVIPGAGVKVEATTIRRGGGVGLDLAYGTSAPQAAVTGNVVTGGLSYPLRGYAQQLALVSAADQANLVGNASDSIDVYGGTLASATLTMTPALPWRVEGNVTVDTQAVLVAQPGAKIAMGSSVSFVFQRGGRLSARGTWASPILWTRVASSGNWGGLYFTSTTPPSDSSYLTNARVEYPSNYYGGTSAAVYASGTHRVVLDSVLIRQAQYSAVRLDVAGSRLSRSEVDTSGTGGNYPAVMPGAGVTVEATTIRRAGGVGLDLAYVTSAPQAAVIGNVVTGGLSYPLRAYAPQVTLVSPADQANLVGNASDSIEVSGGTLTNATLTLTPVLPWRVEGSVTVDTGGVLVVQPGAHLAMGSGVYWYFGRGGRLVARGTSASPIVWTRYGSSGNWGGLYFTSSTPPSDSSYLTNARLEYLSYYSGTAAVYATGAHRLVLDSVLIRQAAYGAVRLDVAGSRLSRSEVDTSGTASAVSAVTLAAGTKVEATTVRNTSSTGIVASGAGVRIVGTRMLGAAGVGIDASGGTLADLTGTRVTGGGSYPMRATVGSLTAPGFVPDSLLGNGRDTLVIAGGSARIGAFTIRPSLPWRVENSSILDSGSMLTIQPGAGMVLGSYVQIRFIESGRLVAHGTPSQPIVFTAINPASPWGGLSFEGRSGVYLGGVPRDTSLLINARLEYGGAYTAVASSGKHVVLVDSSVIRQSAGSAVYLNSPLSRISRSSVDTTASGSAVTLGDSTFLDTVTVRSSGGTGVYVSGSYVHLAGARVLQAQGTGLDAGQGQLTQGGPVHVTGGASYPLRTTLEHLRLILPDSVAQDSLRGNTKDSVLVVGGTLTSSTQVMRSVLPWVFQGSATFDAGAVLAIRPGIAFQMPSGAQLTFQNGGRLIARGTALLPIQFAPSNLVNPWGGLFFQGSPGDSSYLTNAVIFRGGWSSWAIRATGSHPLIVDSTLVRQSRYNAVSLESPGSRFSRSTVDSTNRDNSGVVSSNGVGLNLGAGTLAEASTIRNAGGTGVTVTGAGARIVASRVLNSVGMGIDASSGTVNDLAGTRVTGSGSYPFHGQVQAVPFVIADSMLGNAQDSLVITGGTLTAATATLTATLPWRVEGSVTVDTQAVLLVQPGAHLAMGSGVYWYFGRGARLVARGTAANPIVFTRFATSGTWGGLYFTSSTPPSDSSYLTNVRLEYPSYYSGSAAVYASGAHPLVLDSVLIRQAQYSAVRLDVAGSRLSRSEIDTSGTVGNYAAVIPGAGVKVEATTIRRAGGVGLDLGSVTSVPQAAVTGNVVTGGLSYPLRGYPQQLALVSAADQANLVGNASDSIDVYGGTLANGTLTVAPALPWRVEGGVTVDTQALLVVQPGGKVAMSNGVSFIFQRGGRLSARGTAASPILWTRFGSTGNWGGLYFTSTTQPSDSSYLTNARLEYPSYYGPTAAVYATGTHRVVLDTVLIRQAQYSAVRLDVAGSRLSRSEIDTSGTVGNYPAVAPGAGVKVEATTIRRAGGVGLDLAYGTSAPQAAVTGNVVTGGLSYPLRGYAQQLALVSAADQAGLVGNAQDSVELVGGTLASATLTLTLALPWRVEGTVTVDTQALLVVQPGAKLAIGGGVSFVFQRGGRLSARGTWASPILWTRYAASGNWGGLYFTSTTPPSDSSYLTNARLEYPSYYSSVLAAVWASGTHRVALDTVLIRQAQYSAVRLDVAGSRVSHSEVDTAGTGGYDAVILNAGTKLEGTRLRRAGNNGISASGSGISITQSEITNSVSHGIYLSGTLTGLTIVNCNLIGNAGVGINNASAIIINAINNWWNDASGPTGTNGDGVSANVTYTPFLTSAVTIPVPFP